MTLIVGLWTKQGAVIAADSAATFSAGPMPTISHSNQRKISIIAGKVMLACSGPVGLAQGLAHDVNQLVSTNDYSKISEPIPAIREIRNCIAPEIQRAIDQSNKAAVGLQDASLLQNARITAVCGFIFNRGKQFGLAEIMADGNVELKTPNAPFVSIGSGQVTADPFTKFAVKVIGGDADLTLAQATLAAIWSVSHGIECSPGGIDHPITSARIARDGQDWVIEELDTMAVDEHTAKIESIEASIKEACKDGGPEAVNAPPEP